MVSMGKYGGTFVRSNSRGTTQITFGSRTNQSSANGIFGQQNNTTASKNSVSDIKRMLARDSRSTQTQAANSLGQESIVTSTLSYSEALRNQRQQAKNTTLALKKLKYQFKNISSKILRSKTSQAAKQAAGQARREVLRLKRQKQSGNYDDDEIEAAINHAKAMERVAKKKAKHLEEEELAKAAGGICQGDRISEEETKDAQDTEAENVQNAEEMSRDLSAYEYAGSEAYAGDSYDISDYIDLGIDAFYAQTGDFMSEMSDFTSEMMQEMSDSLRDLMEEMGLDGLSDSAVSVNREMDPADLKMMKIKHRNKEMKEIVKADAEYLKAVFDHLEKMKDNPVIPSGGGVSLSAGYSGTSFSADAAGIGAQVAPAPVIDISL
ncbi:MAG: hypothetical protein SO043_05325 [Lachnospiraceae bacterium]|nr:hypothetical protein [Lachnospiraceae bacterium]